MSEISIPVQTILIDRDSAQKAQTIATQWLWMYNNVRPNSGIGKIAMLGGFLGRKRDEEPDSESIWIELSKVRGSVFTLGSIREFRI